VHKLTLADLLLKSFLFTFDWNTQGVLGIECKNGTEDGTLGRDAVGISIFA